MHELEIIICLNDSNLSGVHGKFTYETKSNYILFS